MYGIITKKMKAKPRSNEIIKYLNNIKRNLNKERSKQSYYILFNLTPRGGA
jgi:hypothetical protein